MDVPVAGPGRSFKARQTLVQFVIVALICLGLGFPTLRWLADPPNPIDVMLSLMGHNTVYSEGYGGSRWRGLRRGMTTAEVEKTMGSPLEIMRYPGQEETWIYSKSGGGNGNYWMRNVIFRRGRIDKIYDRFYVD